MTQNHDLGAMVGWAGKSLMAPAASPSPSLGLGTCWEPHLLEPPHTKMGPVASALASQSMG